MVSSSLECVLHVCAAGAIAGRVLRRASARSARCAGTLPGPFLSVVVRRGCVRSRLRPPSATVSSVGLEDLSLSSTLRCPARLLRAWTQRCLAVISLCWLPERSLLSSPIRVRSSPCVELRAALLRPEDAASRNAAEECSAHAWNVVG